MKFLKEQEARGLISNLTGVKIPFPSDITLIKAFLKKYKTNVTVDKVLKQPEVTYSACSPFTENKERIKKLKKQEIQDIFIEMN